jgi:hypothetical protein
MARLIGVGLAFGIALGGCGGSAFSSSDSDAGGGGTAATGGSISGTGGATGGLTGGGGTGGYDQCARVDCAYPVCPDGVPVVVPEGQCCPICSCELVDCAVPICPPGVGVVTLPGECCPVCERDPAASCSEVTCNTMPTCPDGYAPGSIAGACCPGCVRSDEPIVPPVCTEALCPAPECAPGYRSEQLESECCPRCQPDPKYCQEDADCMVATSSRSCCSCPEAISIRQYEQDACWQNSDGQRSVPEACYPPTACTNVLCEPCAPSGLAKCVEHQCTLLTVTF